MIYLYTGTPGSGKSLDVANEIYKANLINKTVICNFPINEKALKKRKNKESFIYKNNLELSPKYLIDFSKENCVKGKENQVLLIIDEAQVLFNAREWNVKDRKEWCEFFQLHRHYGYKIILVTQFDRLIDRQIRSLVEYEIIHRKLNNYGFVGSLLGIVTLSTLFVRIEYWYGMKQKISSSFYRGNKRLYKLYDSYISFNEEQTEDNIKKIEDQEEQVINYEKKSLQKKKNIKKDIKINNQDNNLQYLTPTFIPDQEDEDFSYMFLEI